MKTSDHSYLIPIAATTRSQKLITYRSIVVEDWLWVLVEEFRECTWFLSTISFINQQRVNSVRSLGVMESFDDRSKELQLSEIFIAQETANGGNPITTKVRALFRWTYYYVLCLSIWPINKRPRSLHCNWRRVQLDAECNYICTGERLYWGSRPTGTSTGGIAVLCSMKSASIDLWLIVS